MSKPLTSQLATYYAKPLMVRLVGQEAYDWWESAEYKELVTQAQALSPGKNWADRRTKAYKYLKWHEPRARKLWLKEQPHEQA